MNSRDAIRIKNLGKQYKIYKHPVDPIIELASNKSRHVTRSALEDINLTVKHGEIVGILGRNGAGKSTLLRIVAGTLKNTIGSVEVDGRISAILELGTGFHPEYSGRDNIYMGGLCMGMTREEIKSRVEEIIHFSELHEVIDLPFKTYSTGMQARLTFSTAISIEPQILIVDEALSVGDVKFQKKCFNWMKNLKKKNATILLVSHDTNTVTSLCDRAIILESGRIFSEGEPKKVTEEYQNLLFGSKTIEKNNSSASILETESGGQSKTVEIGRTRSTAKEHQQIRYGNGKALIESWGLFDNKGKPINTIRSGADFILEMQVNTKQDIDDISCGFAIKDKRGTVLWGMTNISDNNKTHVSKTGEKIKVIVSGRMWLSTGEYFIVLGLAHDTNGEKIDFIEDAIKFSVTGTESIFTTSIVNLESNLFIEEAR
jgi:ABC-type polysaccharide/polyol phosphate transport system ATPase subunit